MPRAFLFSSGSSSSRRVKNGEGVSFNLPFFRKIFDNIVESTLDIRSPSNLFESDGLIFEEKQE
uniref:Uncharacterized protein n=1 Tax=Glossina pallidipes TaxID=7398 RepID=A0A1A9ZCZ2_GLOPL